MDWEKLAGYLTGGGVQHGRHRAAEIREVVETEIAMGPKPLMAAATAERQDWLADEAIAAPQLKALKDQQARELLDRGILRLKAKPKA